MQKTPDGRRPRPLATERPGLNPKAGGAEPNPEAGRSDPNPEAERAEPNPEAEPAGPDPRRLIAVRFGLSAESRAAAYLIAKGYRILSRRVRTAAGEIDIVARRRGVVVFVEVKARDNFDAAAEAIGRRQQLRIMTAAQIWLAANPQQGACDMRFDVVLVAPRGLPRHLPGAFDASA